MISNKNDRGQSGVARRQALGYLAAGLGCATCAALFRPSSAAAAAAQGEPPHWGYEGAIGPDRWGSLSNQYGLCSSGIEQTPIDLANGMAAQIGGLTPRFGSTAVTILNNGHTIQVNCDPGSATNIRGTDFSLLQFHFHHPSEHTIAGRRYELEVHFVHRSAAGKLAVLGVMFVPGAAHPVLQTVWDVMPAQERPAAPTGRTINMAAFLPAERSYFRYQGSLTTPPCSEDVLWTVFKNSISCSTAQIAQFSRLFANNARPLQPLNRRFLLESS
jgi:carbonic anhydrase